MELIRCSNCGTSNPPEARFCRKCGFRFILPPGGIPEQPQTTEDEIRQLRDLATYINTRLDALEGKGSAAVPPPVPTPMPQELAAVTPGMEAPPVTAWEAPPPEQKRTAVKEREWEQILGGNWLARIGVLALVIGIGFFLKYAFDNNWLGPTARVILGVVAGLVMLGLGYYWRKRYPIMTQVLSGGGIAVLYLAIFASFATYNLLNIYVAIVLLLIISGISTALALRYNSMALAILGILGAFFAPFISGAFSERGADAGSTGQAVQLLIYIIVIDIGVLLLSTLRNWRWFTLLALACSLITYGFWHNEFDRTVSTATAEIGITAIFLIFVGATSLFHIIRHRIPQIFDYVLMAGTAAAYTGISLGLMWNEYRAWLGGFLLLLAIFYGLLSFVAYKRNTENTRLSLFSLAIALIILTVAIPVQFRDHATTTIAWAIEMAACVWLSFIVKIPLLRYGGYAVFIAMFWRLLIFDTTVNTADYRPILNERFLAYIIAIAATYLTVYILWRRTITERRFIAPVLLIAINFLTLWLISFEVWDAFSNAIRAAGQESRESLRDAQNLSLTAVWAVYAVAGLIIGIKKHWRYVRLGSLGLLAVPIIKVFVYDVFKLEMNYRIGAFVGLGLLLLASAYLYQRYRKIIKGVFSDK